MKLLERHEVKGVRIRRKDALLRHKPTCASGPGVFIKYQILSSPIERVCHAVRNGLVHWPNVWRTDSQQAANVYGWEVRGNVPP